MRIACALVLVYLALPALPAQAGQNGSIDLFPFGIDPSTGVRTTPDFGACQATVTSIGGGLVGRLSFGVYARLGGATLAGISGTEMYLQGLEVDAPGQLPPGWMKSIMLPPGTLDIGVLSDPNTLGAETRRRWDMVWSVEGQDDPDCQREPLVLLAIVDLTSSIGFGTNFANNHYLTVTGGDPPANPSFSCPLLSLCNNPLFTLYCVSGGRLIINPTDRSCTVAVEQATWSRVKGLYR